VKLLPMALVTLATAAGLSASAVSTATQADAAPLAPPSTTVGVVMTTAPRYLVGQLHAAFPGMWPTPSGGLELVYRQGTDHVTARDGSILSVTLDSTGRNPSSPATLLSGGTDYRDPSVSYIDGHRYLTYFTGSAANAAQGAMVSRDGGPAVRIDPTYPFAAISAPVVKLPDGRLGTAYYARQPGEALYKAYMAWSSDLGQTWTSNRILNPATDATPEPYLVVDGASVHLLARWGDTSIAIRTLGGATWADPRIARTNATGRPTTYRTSSGLLVMVYRSLPTKAASLAYSADHGLTWYNSTQIMAAPAGSANGMTYAAVSEVLPGVIRLVVGMEQADGTSALYSTTLAESVR